MKVLIRSGRANSEMRIIFSVTITAFLLFVACGTRYIGGVRAISASKNVQRERISGPALVDSRNDNSYRTVEIGGAVWMAENLNHEVDNGNSWCYEDDESNCQKYGRLYDWYTANEACPIGWRLPTRQEWRDLISVAGGSREASGKLTSATGWKHNGTDNYGFSALPSGIRNANGSFDYVDAIGFWWSATENPSADEKTHDALFGRDVYSVDGAYYLKMFPSSTLVIEQYIIKSYGFSVRCIQD